MSDWEIVRHQVFIAGRVADAQTGRAIAGARVRISDGPEVFTAADGHFHFLDLTPGEYTLQASLPGAGTRYGQSKTVPVTVSQDKDGKYTLDPAELELPPTTIKGKITDKEGKGLAMAEVRVVGSGERTYSDGEGNYRLTGLETGKCTVVVSARGYWDAEKTVTLERPGQAVMGVDLTLTPTTEPEPAPPAQACGTQPPPTAPNRRRGQKSRE